MENRSFLKRILATYLCIMLIPMVCSVAIYEYILTKNTEKVKGVLENSFQNNINGIKADLNTIESTTDSIALNPEFSEFFHDYTFGSEITTNEMLGFRKLLSSYRFDMEITDSVFIYSKYLDTLMDFDYIYHDCESFFKEHYRVESESAAETSERLVNGNISKYTTNTKIANDYKSYPIIEFQKQVPIVGDQADGYITVFIKADKLFSPFAKVLDESNGYMQVFYEGNPLYSYGKVLKNEKINTFSFSEENGMWKYELSVPESYVMKDTRAMNMVLIILNTVALIIGSLLCVYFAMKKVRAYEDIILKMDLVESDFDSGKGDEIEKIGKFINELVKNKDEAEQELLEQKRIGNAYDCLQKLLYGRYKSCEEAQYAINENGVVLDGDMYAVMLLSFENGVKNVEDEIAVKGFVQSSLKEFTGDVVYTYYIDTYTIAVLISFDGEESDFSLHLKNMASSIRLEFVYKYNIKVYMCVGNIVRKLNEISASLSGANEVLDYVKILGEDKLVLHSQLPEEGDDCYYSTEIEEEILKCVNTGDSEKAAQILKDVKKKNLRERSLSLANAKKLATRIETTIIKINERPGRESGFVFERKTLSELLDYAVEYVQIVASSAKKPAEKRSDILHNEIVEYVNNNYADSELSLEKLSAKFNLNIAYMSTVFRKKTGDTFLHYVERLRINKACEMIVTSEYKISAIAYEVGYANDTSFRRSFKRIMGVSPSQYYAESMKQQ